MFNVTGPCLISSNFYGVSCYVVIVWAVQGGGGGGGGGEGVEV